jgi:hypothetical protein
VLLIPVLSLTWFLCIYISFFFFSPSAKGHGEKVSTWEHYHQQDSGKGESRSTGRPSSSAGLVRLDPYNNLQLHPNYGAACQVSAHIYYVQSRLLFFYFSEFYCRLDGLAICAPKKKTPACPVIFLVFKIFIISPFWMLPSVARDFYV